MKMSNTIGQTNDLELVFKIKGHEKPISSIAMEGSTIVTGSVDQTVKVWDAMAKKLLHTLTGHTMPVTQVAIHGDIIVSASSDGDVRIWRKSTGKLLEVLKNEFPVNCVATDGTYIVGGINDGTFKVWQQIQGFSSFQLMHTVKAHSFGVSCAAISGEWIVTGSYDKSMKIWSKYTGALISLLPVTLEDSKFFAMENSLLVIPHKQNIYIWDTDTQDMTLFGNSPHKDFVNRVAINGNTVVTGGGNTVGVWTLHGKLVKALTTDSDVLSIASKGRNIATGTYGGFIYVWSDEAPKTVPSLPPSVTAPSSPNLPPTLPGEKDFKLIRKIEAHKGSANGVDIEGNIIVTGGEDESLRVWNKTTGTLLHTLPASSDEAQVGKIKSVKINGNKIVSGSRNSDVLLWNFEKLLSIMDAGPTDSVNAVAIDSEVIVAGSLDHNVYVWRNNEDDPKLLLTLEGHTASVSSVAIFEEVIASGSRDGTVKVWNKNTGDLENTWVVGWPVYAVAMQNDKIAASGDKTLSVYDDLKEHVTFSKYAHNDKIVGVAISYDKIASAGVDGKIKIWNLQTGSELQTLEIGEKVDWVRNVAMRSEDGNTFTIAAVTDKGYLYIYRNSGEEPIVEKGKEEADDNENDDNDDDNDDDDNDDDDDEFVPMFKLVMKIHAHDGPIESISYDGLSIASAGGDDETIKFWDNKGGYETEVAASSTVNSVATYATDYGISLVSGNEDGSIDAWSGHNMKYKQIKNHKGTVACVAIGAKNDSEFIISGGRKDKRINVYKYDDNEDTLNLLHQLKVRDPVTAIAMDNSGNFVSGNFVGKVISWDLETGKSKKKIDAGSPIISISIEGDNVIIGCDNGLVKLWNISTNQLKVVHDSFGKGGVVGVKILGNLVVSVSEMSVIHVWDLAKGHLVNAVEIEDGDSILSIDFQEELIQENDKRIVASTEKGFIYVWSDQKPALPLKTFDQAALPPTIQALPPTKKTAIEALVDESRTYIEGLNANSQSTLRKYTGDSYKQMNKCLRKERTKDDVRCNESLAELDRILVNGPRLSEPIVVLRAFDPDKPTSKKLDEILKALKPSDVFEERAFLSTSYELQSQFLGSTCCVIEIHIPAGVNVLAVESISAVPKEKELLLSAGMGLQLVETYQNSNGITVYKFDCKYCLPTQRFRKSAAPSRMINVGNREQEHNVFEPLGGLERFALVNSTNLGDLKFWQKKLRIADPTHIVIYRDAASAKPNDFPFSDLQVLDYIVTPVNADEVLEDIENYDDSQAMFVRGEIPDDKIANLEKLGFKKVGNLSKWYERGTTASHPVVKTWIVDDAIMVDFATAKSPLRPSTLRAAKKTNKAEKKIFGFVGHPDQLEKAIGCPLFTDGCLEKFKDYAKKDFYTVSPTMKKILLFAMHFLCRIFGKVVIRNAVNGKQVPPYLISGTTAINYWIQLLGGKEYKLPLIPTQDFDFKMDMSKSKAIQDLINTELDQQKGPMLAYLAKMFENPDLITDINFNWVNQAGGALKTLIAQMKIPLFTAETQREWFGFPIVDISSNTGIPSVEPYRILTPEGLYLATPEYIAGDLCKGWGQDYKAKRREAKYKYWNIVFPEGHRLHQSKEFKCE